MPTDVGNIYLSAHLNASQCALNEKDWPGACAYATRAIKCVPEREGVEMLCGNQPVCGSMARVERRRHRHAIEQAPRRWREVDADSRTRRV